LGVERKAYAVLVGHVQNRDYLEELSVDGRIILKGILVRMNGVEWIYVVLMQTIGWLVTHH
jgi:hypothetical protein